MASAPDHSLPKQCDGWGDVKAAYRFLHHQEVSPERIQQTHRQNLRASLVRADHPVVLAVQDTTELDYTTQTMAQGLGPVGQGTRQGLLQHSTLAVTPDGHLHGVLHQIWKARVPKPEGETRTQMRLWPKESDLWPDSVRAIEPLGDGTRLVHVADRGGDTFDMMLQCYRHGVGFLIRSPKDRRINGQTDKLWHLSPASPRLFWLTIAERGGYLARKRDGPPGWQTIWKGWSNFMLMVLGVELYLQANELETYG